MSRIITVDRKHEIMSACLLGAATLSQPAVSYALKETDYRNAEPKPLVRRYISMWRTPPRPEYRYGAERTWPNLFEESEESAVAMHVRGGSRHLAPDTSLFVAFDDDYESVRSDPFPEIDLLASGLMIDHAPYKELGTTSVLASYIGPMKPRNIGEDEDDWF